MIRLPSVSLGILKNSILYSSLLRIILIDRVTFWILFNLHDLISNFADWIENGILSPIHHTWKQMTAKQMHNGNPMLGSIIFDTIFIFLSKKEKRYSITILVN